MNFFNQDINYNPLGSAAPTNFYNPNLFTSGTNFFNP